MKLNVLITSYAFKYNSGDLIRGRDIPVCAIHRECSVELESNLFLLPSFHNPETALIVQ